MAGMVWRNEIDGMSNMDGMAGRDGIDEMADMDRWDAVDD